MPFAAEVGGDGFGGVAGELDHIVAVSTADGTGNVTGVEDPSGRTLYGYDAADQLTSLTDQAGKVTGYGYDNAGNRTSASLPGGSKQAIEVEATTATYDGAGNLSTTTPRRTGPLQLHQPAHRDHLRHRHSVQRLLRHPRPDPARHDHRIRRSHHHPPRLHPHRPLL